MRVINIFGAPGTGKSTLAAGVYHKMKLSSMGVELVTEYAKELVWENRLDLLQSAQYYIFAKQLRRMQRLLAHKLNYAITDSPCLMGAAYMDEEHPVYKEYLKIFHYEWDRFDNINFFLYPRENYEQTGRLQNAAESQVLSDRILKILTWYEIPYHVVTYSAIDAIIAKLA